MNAEFDPFRGSFDSLETLADAISEVLGCPVTIEDAQHRLLAYSSHQQEVTDEARMATIMGRRVPERVINSLWHQGVIQQLNESLEPVQIDAIKSVGLGNRVAIGIHKDQSLLGYIWAIANRPFDREDNRFLRLAAKAATTKLLQLKARKRREEEGHQEFFWRLLTGDYPTHDSLIEQAKALKVDVPSAFSTVVFQFQRDITVKQHEQMSYIANTTQKARTLFTVSDQKQLVLLLAPHHTKELSQTTCANFISTTIRTMQERFGIGPLFGAAGDVYTRLEQVQKSYHEALTVLELKQQFPVETKDIHTYPRLGFYRYFPAFLKQKALEGYTNPYLKRLRQYDAQHHAHLVETLESFLDCDSNYKETANALHIHINTLNYRLKRIAEIGEIDLKDAVQKFSLYLDIKLERNHM